MMLSLKGWRTDKLKATLTLCWLATVFFSFFGNTIALMHIPGVGVMYPFRLLLPATALIYAIWAIREKQNPWKNADLLQRLCYVFCVILIIYSGFSLRLAMDFGISLKSWVNLCMDLCFFFLALELCKDRRIFHTTAVVVAVSALILAVMGIYESFCGGIFHDRFDSLRNILFFNTKVQNPVVTTANPNNYSAMLVFMLAVVLLNRVWQGRGKKNDWLPVFLVAAVYFLLSAAQARLCMVAFVALLAVFLVCVPMLGKRKYRLVALILLLLGIVKLGFNSTWMYEQEAPQAHSGATQSVTVASVEQAPETYEFVLLSTNVVAEEHEVSLSNAPDQQILYKTNGNSFKDEFFTKDEETGEYALNTTRSAGIRLTLLLGAFDCFIESKGMGVGLRNTEQIVLIGDDQWGIHCFLARMTADLGIFFLIPFLLIAIALLRACFVHMGRCIRRRDKAGAAMWLLYLAALVSYPIASTAPSDAQDILAMWLFLAWIVCFPMHATKTEEN